MPHVYILLYRINGKHMKLIYDGNSLAYGQTIETAERQNVVASSIQISKGSLPSKL